MFFLVSFARRSKSFTCLRCVYKSVKFARMGKEKERDGERGRECWQSWFQLR